MTQEAVDHPVVAAEADRLLQELSLLLGSHDLDLDIRAPAVTEVVIVIANQLSQLLLELAAAEGLHPCVAFAFAGPLAVPRVVVRHGEQEREAQRTARK